MRNTLQPGTINSASTNTGTAVIAGEVEKDSKYAGSVEGVGAASLHLLLKCWKSGLLQVYFCLAPLLKESLNTMASRRPLVPCNVMQQHSVKLGQDDPTGLWFPTVNGPFFKCICFIIINFILLSKIICGFSG